MNAKKTEIKAGKFNTMVLTTTIYNVGDIIKTKKWYTRAFGTQPDFNKRHYAVLDPEENNLGLQLGGNSKNKKPIANQLN